MSRHRGAKLQRQYELSSAISLFNGVITENVNFCFLVSLQGSDYIINLNFIVIKRGVRCQSLFYFLAVIYVALMSEYRV